MDAINYIAEKTEAIEAFNAILPRLIAFFKNEPRIKNNGELYQVEQAKLDEITSGMQSATGYMYCVRSRTTYTFRFCFTSQTDARGCTVCEYFELRFYSDAEGLERNNKALAILSAAEIMATQAAIAALKKREEELRREASHMTTTLYHYGCK